jgi:hypothetical protein
MTQQRRSHLDGIRFGDRSTGASGTRPHHEPRNRDALGVVTILDLRTETAAAERPPLDERHDSNTGPDQRPGEHRVNVRRRTSNIA